MIILYAHGIVVMIVPRADDRAVVSPNYPVGDGHGRGNALQPHRFRGRPVLSPGAADGRSALHEHRHFGVNVVESRSGSSAMVPARGRGRDEHRQIARGAHHLWVHVKAEVYTNGK